MSSLEKPLDQLLKSPQVWRASSIGAPSEQGIATGFPELDQHLQGHGWPANGLVEVLHDDPGIGELRLLAPALSSLSQQNRWIIWVSPPYIPYAPALKNAGIDIRRILVVTPRTSADTLWVLEKALSSHSCSAVLAWAGQMQNPLREKDLRRLQVASKNGRALGVIYRQGQHARQASPAELRIRLWPRVSSPLSEHGSLDVEILKRKGGWPVPPLTIEFQDQLNQMTPDFSELSVQNASGQPFSLTLFEDAKPRSDNSDEDEPTSFRRSGRNRDDRYQ